MAIFAYILVGVALLPYIVVPILIWATQRFSPEIQLRCLEENFLPKAIATEFRSFSDALKTHNFESCFDALIQDEFLGLRFYHRVMLSPVHKTWAICTAICSEGGVLERKYDEFKTQSENGLLLSTHNSDLIGAPINSHKRKILALPAATKTAVSLEIHLLNLTKMKTMHKLVTPEAANALETFKHFLSQDHDEQIELGAIYLDPREEMYRPSWAGAFLIGWYSMWPSTFLRRIFSTIKVRSLMKEIAQIRVGNA